MLVVRKDENETLFVVVVVVVVGPVVSFAWQASAIYLIADSRIVSLPTKTTTLASTTHWHHQQQQTSACWRVCTSSKVDIGQRVSHTTHLFGLNSL